jgi:hypothetical protein
MGPREIEAQNFLKSIESKFQELAYAQSLTEFNAEVDVSEKTAYLNVNMYLNFKKILWINFLGTSNSRNEQLWENSSGRNSQQLSMVEGATMSEII